MTATMQSPNGVATGFVYRRRFKTIVYPTSVAEYEAMGYRPQSWREDLVGFTARAMAAPNGAEERALLEARAAFRKASLPETDEEGKTVKPPDQARLMAAREDYFRELAWRIPEWNWAEEDAEGNAVRVAAPGDAPGNWQAFDLLPSVLAWWLIEEIMTCHLPDPTSAPPVGITATPIPTSTPQETTPPPSS